MLEERRVRRRPMKLKLNFAVVVILVRVGHESIRALLLIGRGDKRRTACPFVYRIASKVDLGQGQKCMK